MNLSIIVPIYRKKKELTIFLKKIVDQTSFEFEIIFIIDTNSENILETIEEYAKQIKGKIKIIFNSKRIGRNNAIKIGLKESVGKFVTIISISNFIEETYVDQINKLIKIKPADIIEFKATMKDPIKLNGNMRSSIKNVVEIQKRPSIIAYTYPFDFNKIFKTEVIQKALEHKIETVVNSRFSISYIYIAFMIAKTYSNSNKKIVLSKSYLTQDFNPLQIVRQWEELQKYLLNTYKNKYIEEIKYATFMHISILLFALVGVSKNKILINKMYEIYKKSLEGPFKNFLDNNKYGILKNDETKKLRENKDLNNTTKIYKEIW